MKREKFDAFVKYVQALEEKLEAAEDARDVAKYRARKAGKTADVLQALTEDVLRGTAAVREWLGSPSHTIQELSTRTGIPYATCHRIVNERLGTPNVEIGHLKKMVSAVSRDRRPFAPGVASHPRYRRVLFGLPDLILVDVSMPNLEKSGLGLLKDFAKDTKRTIVLTGEIVETNSALLQGSFEKRTEAEELASEAEIAGG